MGCCMYLLGISVSVPLGSGVVGWSKAARANKSTAPVHLLHAEHHSNLGRHYKAMPMARTSDGIIVISDRKDSCRVSLHLFIYR